MEHGLARTITGPQFFAVAFGCIVGVGWVVVLGDMIVTAGAGATALAITLGGLGVLLVALCYAEMAARMPAAGGELVYAYALGGPVAAYVTGWTLALVYTATCAFEAISIGKLAALLFPALKGPMLYSVFGQEVRLGGIGIGLVATLGLWWLNAAGARGTARAQAWVTGVRILLMLGFLGIALAWGRPANLVPLFHGASADARLLAFLGVLGTAPFWFGGFNVVASASEEAAVSMRVVGRALILAIIASGLFYIALTFTVAALVPVDRLATMELPAAQAFEAAMGTPWVARIVLATALLGNLTAWNGLMLAGSRVFFALGRAHLSPAALARVSPASGAPVLAVAAVSLASIAGLLLGNGFILPLVNIASTAFGFTYLVTCLALLRLRRMDPMTRPDFAVPGGVAVIAAAAIVAAAITLVSLVQPWIAGGGRMPVESLTILGWIAISGVMWIVTRRSIHDISEAERARRLCGAAAGDAESIGRGIMVTEAG